MTNSERREYYDLEQRIKELEAIYDEQHEEFTAGLQAQAERIERLTAERDELKKHDIRTMNCTCDCAEHAEAMEKRAEAAEARIKELTQEDPCWYDMSEADAFRMWKADREKMTRYRTALESVANRPITPFNAENQAFKMQAIAREALGNDH